MQVRPASLRNDPFALFFETSVFSARVVWAEPTGDGRRVSQVVEQWRHSFAADFEVKPVTLCWSMPASFAVLLSKRAWSSCGFPLPSGRSAGSLGLSLVRSLVEPLRAPQQFPLLPQVDALSPDVWQGVADFIRKEPLDSRGTSRRRALATFRCCSRWSTMQLEMHTFGVHVHMTWSALFVRS